MTDNIRGRIEGRDCVTVVYSSGWDERDLELALMVEVFAEENKRKE
jgi:hypothetical protein